MQRFGAGVSFLTYRCSGSRGIPGRQVIWRTGTMRRRAQAVACVVATSLLSAAASTQPRTPNYITLADVRPLLAPFAASLPPDLPTLSGPQATTRWRTWVANHDRTIRQRLREGDEDTLLNWLLLGRSFTSLPPVSVFSGATEAAVANAAELIRQR